nr:Peptidase C48, SUMO/Sentrin/Ubl1 [Ipomoea batatas]
MFVGCFVVERLGVCCFIAKTIVRADIIEPRYCGGTTKGTVEGGPTPLQGPLAGGGSNTVVFAYKKRDALVADFLSLQFETDVRVAVIECWVCVLNEKEKYKRVYSPSRFFVSALTSIQTIVPTTASRERRLRWFVKRLDGNFDIAPHINRCTVDLKDLLSSYLEKKGHPVRAATARNLKPTRLRIGWRDCQNNVDCAVYAMRHTETFMGRPHSRWDCDLENGNR